MVETLVAAPGGGVDTTIYKIASDTFADQGSEIDRMLRRHFVLGNHCVDTLTKADVATRSVEFTLE